jgi:arginase family enzyme
VSVPGVPGSALTMLLAQKPPFIPSPAEVMTAIAELPSGQRRDRRAPRPACNEQHAQEKLMYEALTEASRAAVANFFGALRTGDMDALRAAFAPGTTWILRGGPDPRRPPLRQ